jgi:hypothetical protein
MAFQHIFVNRNFSPEAFDFYTTVNDMRASDRRLLDLRAKMLTMIDGDGSQAVHFAEITARYGFVNDAASKAAFEELDSCYSKTSGDGQVSFVRAARDQLFAKIL